MRIKKIDTKPVRERCVLLNTKVYSTDGGSGFGGGCTKLDKGIN